MTKGIFVVEVEDPVAEIFLRASYNVKSGSFNE